MPRQDTGRLGQIALCNGTNAVARIVQAAIGSPFSHVIIDIGEGLVASAQIGGLELRPVEDFPDAVWSQYDFHQWQAEGAADYAAARVGTPYNIASLPAVLLTRALQIPTRTTRAYAYYQCAQLAEDALMHGAGILVFPEGRTAGPATPADFEALFRRNGWL